MVCGVFTVSFSAEAVLLWWSILVTTIVMGLCIVSTVVPTILKKQFPAMHLHERFLQSCTWYVKWYRKPQFLPKIDEMSDKTGTLSVPNLPIMESISAEIASLLQKAHIQALPDAIATRLPFLLKRINVLAHRRSNNVRELNELTQLNAQLRRLAQASVPLRQLSGLQARRLPKVACDGNPAASKVFEMGLREANSKVEQAVEDILSLESYLSMVVDVVPVYYFDDGQD